MKRAFAFFCLVAACDDGEVASSPIDERPNETPRAAVAKASSTWLGPNDFDGNRLDIAVPASASGETVVVVVPELTSADWLKGEDLDTRALDFSVAVTALDAPPEAVPGHAMPSLGPIAAEEWTAPPSNVAASPLAEERTFDVYAAATGSYESFAAKRSFVGKHFAYYDDVANEAKLSAAEYEALDGEVSSRYAELVRIFGDPGDADGNGKHLVVMSKTAWLARKTAGEAYVDGKADGEIVNIWSLDGLGSLADQKWLTRTILHETVHLSQNAHARRRGITLGARRVPAFWVEGMAETMRIRNDLGGDDSSDIRSSSPFSSPYRVGGLLAWWLERRFGDGVHQRLIDASLEATVTRDLTSAAFNVPEPMVLAWFWSEQPVTAAELPLGGDGFRGSIAYTASAIRRVKTSAPVRITFRAENDERATVLIVRR